MKQAAYEIMEKAYEKVRGPENYQPTPDRSCMPRDRIFWSVPKRKLLDDAYFTQTLLPDYQEEHGVDWDVVYDDRGHFREPHTGYTFGLGTLAGKKLSRQHSRNPV